MSSEGDREMDGARDTQIDKQNNWFTEKFTTLQVLPQVLASWYNPGVSFLQSPRKVGAIPEKFTSTTTPNRFMVPPLCKTPTLRRGISLDQHSRK